jgi:exopolysaccharide biosynthesis polyprenyl glycosylphosphotransferase
MRAILSQPYQKYRFLLVTGDLLVILASISMILSLEFLREGSLPWDFNKTLAIFISICGLIVLVFYILNLYELSGPSSSEIIFLSICFAFEIVITIFGTIAYFFILLQPGRINFIWKILATASSTLLWHNVFHKLFRIKPHRLLFIGQEPIFADISEEIQKNHTQCFALVEHWQRQSHNPALPNLCDFIKEHEIDLVVYSVHSKLAKQQLSNDLITIKFSQKNIIDAYNFYQQVTRKYPVYFLDNFWLLINAQKEKFFPGPTENLKRSSDILFALIFLPLALPLLLISALAVKLNSRGPIFFIQERLGLDEVPFQLYKFRTMVNNAEALTGPKWSTADDPRITRVGRVLRKTRLDELPQLFNVLRGDMSVVGPRPIRKHFADILAREVPYYRLRFLAKPGLTGWAQVSYDYAGSNEGQSKKLQYDLFYLVHQSMRLDLLILFKTIKTMVWGKGT